MSRRAIPLPRASGSVATQITTASAPCGQIPSVKPARRQLGEVDADARHRRFGHRDVGAGRIAVGDLVDSRELSVVLAFDKLKVRLAVGLAQVGQRHAHVAGRAVEVVPRPLEPSAAAASASGTQTVQALTPACS